MLLLLLALDVLRIITYHTLSVCACVCVCVCVWPTTKAVEKGGMVFRFEVSDY